jgi:hypothetical protein
MGMEALLAAALLLQADPKDRLLDAVRDSNPSGVRQALADLTVGRDPARAARALVQALPRARERIDPLQARAERARQALLEVDASVGFNLREEDIKERQKGLLRERVKELEARALDAERAYEALMDHFAFLDPAAEAVLAQELERTGSWILKCEILDGLAALGARGTIRAALGREKEPIVVAAALDGLDDASGLDYLSHPQWQVRLFALRSLRRRREAVPAVVGTLAREDARFRRQAVKTLEELTGTELPPDPKLWKGWWEANRADFEAGTYVSSAPRWPEGMRPTVFYDVALDSTRVCFLIDRSKSMREGERLDEAKRELKRMLELLPDGSLVNVIFFGASTSPIWKGVRVLDAAARQDARERIDRTGTESATDLHGALERALQHVGWLDTGKLREDGVDTIVVLSDGKATWGKVVDDELLAATAARRARYLRPVIHGISLGRESKALQLLAAKTGGEYRMK